MRYFPLSPAQQEIIIEALQNYEGYYSAAKRYLSSNTRENFYRSLNHQELLNLTFEYQGYIGEVIKIEQDNNSFWFGTITSLEDVVKFEGKDISECWNNFSAAIEKYEAYRKSINSSVKLEEDLTYEVGVNYGELVELKNKKEEPIDVYRVA